MGGTFSEHLEAAGSRRSGLRPILQSSAGFTLVEVLIASMILFAAIAIGTAAMRTTLNAMGRLSDRTRTINAFYFVKDLVKEELKEGKASGQGAWGSDCVYEWSTEVLKKSRNAVGEREYGAGVDLGGYMMTLYRVSLKVGFRNEPASKPRTFHYEELVFWRGIE